MAKNENIFLELAKESCNGCDLVTGKENKLTTDDVVAAGVLTVSDFAICLIDNDEVGVVTFEEEPEKYYWGGLSITSMVKSWCDRFGGQKEAREAYAGLKTEQRVHVKFELTKTKVGHDFVAVTAS